MRQSAESRGEFARFVCKLVRGETTRVVVSKMCEIFSENDVIGC